MHHIFIVLKKVLLICLVSLSNISCNEGNQTGEKINSTENIKQLALEIAIKKYRKVANELDINNGHPRAVNNNQWRQTHWQSWTDGFFPGILWQLAIIDDSLENQAALWTLPLGEYALLPSHDVGFIINNSFGKAYRVTGDPKYLSTIETAAQTLANRYNPQVQATRSWDFGSYQFPVIIDNMMNLSLLFSASHYFESEPYYSYAFNHTSTTSKHHIREDGSSFHLVDFNSESGEVIKKSTVQGLNNDSTWARGQAWGVYGFSIAFMETGKNEFKETAINMANYFIEQLPEDKVPYWDLSITDINASKDTSAAAVASSGLWLLSKIVVDKELSNYFKDESLAITSSLLTNKYFNSDINYPALLLHATGNKPSNNEVDTSLIYADYYFIEALLLQLSIVQVPL